MLQQKFLLGQGSKEMDNKIKENEKCFNLTTFKDKLITLNEVEKAQLEANGGKFLTLERHGIFYYLERVKEGEEIRFKIKALNKYIGVSGYYDNTPRCPHCNNKLNSTFKFCPYCGKALE